VTFDLALCQATDIPEGESRGFPLDPAQTNNLPEATVFVVHRDGAFHVYLNRCPHLGLPLEWMPHQFLDREAQYIQCATHGALFRIDTGVCVAGPCPGETLTALPFQIREKSIMIASDDLARNP